MVAVEDKVVQVAGVRVGVRVVDLGGSVLVWIGKAAEPALGNAVFAMNTPYERLPLATPLLRYEQNEAFMALARKAGHKVRRPCFLLGSFPQDIRREEDVAALSRFVLQALPRRAE